MSWWTRCAGDLSPVQRVSQHIQQPPDKLSGQHKLEKNPTDCTRKLFRKRRILNKYHICKALHKLQKLSEFAIPL